jgi:hypothetical protein
VSGTKLLQQCFRAVKGRDSDLGTSFRVDATVSDGTGLEHRAYLAMFSCQICTLVFEIGIQGFWSLLFSSTDLARVCVFLSVDKHTSNKLLLWHDCVSLSMHKNTGIWRVFEFLPRLEHGQADMFVLFCVFMSMHKQASCLCEYEHEVFCVFMSMKRFVCLWAWSGLRVYEHEVDCVFMSMKWFACLWAWSGLRVYEHEVVCVFMSMDKHTTSYCSGVCLCVFEHG